MGGSKSKITPTPEPPPATILSSTSYNDQSVAAPSAPPLPTTYALPSAPSPQPSVPPNIQSISSLEPRTAQYSYSSSTAPVIINLTAIHAVNNYVIPNINTGTMHDQRNFCMPLHSKVDKYSMRVCAKYCSRKGCVTRLCYRFHVCQFWVRSSCVRENCPFDHDFLADHNSNLMQHLLHRMFEEYDLKEQLKKNFYIEKALKESLSGSICMDYITKQCKRDSVNCLAAHVDSPYLWEFNFQCLWIQFPKIQNEKIEKMYCDVQNRFANIDLKSLNSKQSEQVLLQAFRRSSVIKIDFEHMSVTSGNLRCDVRRLSTPSDVGNYKTTATRWQWYWQDERGNWNSYENALVKDFWILPFSDYIECQYLKKSDFTFQLYSQSYNINFNTMTQTNQNTSVSREIKRRPLASPENTVWKTNTTFQSLWTIPNSSEKFRRVNVSPSSPEFHFVQSMFPRTVAAQNLHIERVENPHLWQAYQLKRTQMMKGYGDNKHLNEQYLFHGTFESVVDKICLDNLDWRLYGTNVGNIFGKGTYFANSATISESYAPVDELGYQYMFIVLVLVGTATIGYTNMTFPPINPETKKRFDATVDSVNPRIFVKYNLDEYYPAYLLKFKF